jgi:hypothetical protein
VPTLRPVVSVERRAPPVLAKVEAGFSLGWWMQCEGRTCWATRLSLLACVFILGCQQPDAQTEAPTTATPAVQVSEHRFQAVSAASREVGEDCTANGQSICRSGLCLRVSRGRTPRYVCSQPCPNGDAVCPTDWTCRQVVPAPEPPVCVPSL